MRRPNPGALLICLFPVVAGAQDKVNPGALTLQDFSRRVTEYAKLHNTAKAQFHGLKPTTSAGEIQEYERHLAHRLREQRSTITQGNIFTPEIAAEFKRLIGISLQGPEAARIRTTLDHASPVRLTSIRVNRTYPPGVPLQTTPPSLLLNLPPLPPELEYRVVDHTLILRDSDANLIVDYIPNAIP